MHYSPSTNAFYPSDMRQDYIDAGTFPSDAIAVTDEQWKTYGIGDVPAGKRRAAGENGQPCWVNIEREAANVRRSWAKNWLDTTADRTRASDRSLGQYLDAEYQLVAQALADYRDNPGAPVPEALQSHADAEKISVEAAAQQIAEAAARADELLKAVRRIRLAGKAAIRDADDNADMMETVRPFIDQLEALTAG